MNRSISNPLRSMPKVRKTRTYSETERLGIMTIALRDGIAAASKRTRAPHRTIYQWFAEAGGLAEIRTFASVAADHSLSAAEQAVCQEVTRRMGLKEMSTAELMLTFRALITARAKVAVGGSASSAAGPHASAQIIQVTIDDE